MLAAHFGDPSRPEIVPAALVVELTHLATLYHDDVMDEATVRRGAASANARWDNTIAILTGDFLFSRASNLLADLGTHAVRLQRRHSHGWSPGKSARRSVRSRARPDRALPCNHDGQDRLAVLDVGRVRRVFRRAVAEVTETLRDFGEQIGIAFQLSDDLLDIASDSDASGKTPGTDLREGIDTLPVLYALRGSDPGAARLRELVASPLVDDADHAEALLLLRKSDAMVQARSTMTGYAESARSLLDRLPDVPARAALGALCDLVIERTG